MPPRVSVLMPTYNDGRHLGEAIDSILTQSYTDFELLIVNDGSTDDTGAILRAYSDSDPRIRVISHTTNLGLSAGRNRALEEAAGEYLCFMDGDDIALPGRLQKQVAFMDANPGIAVCGGNVQHFSASEARVNYPPDHATIQAYLFINTPLSNPTVCIRRSSIEKHAVHNDEKLRRSEDYDFWRQMLLECNLKAANLQELLLLYRVRSFVDDYATTREVKRRILPRLGLEVTEELLQTYMEFSLAATREEMSLPFAAYADFAHTVLAANRQRHIFDQTLFEKLVRYRMLLFIQCLAPEKSELPLLALRWPGGIKQKLQLLGKALSRKTR